MNNQSNSTIYDQLKAYVMSLDDQRQHGYPIESNGDQDGHELVSGRVSIHQVSDSMISNDYSTNERICQRCLLMFMVDSDGIPLVNENCYYHNRHTTNSRGNYTCCNRQIGSRACCVAPSHTVSGHGHPDKTLNYVRLPSPTSPSLPSSSSSVVDHHQVYAMDCEMVSTTVGYELARISIVNTELNTVLDHYVKPSNPILDHNTKFSGITGANMKSVVWTLTDVHNFMFEFMSSESIIVGHGLDHDFQVLKLIHSNVIDTAHLYAHPRGLPFRSSLKYLAKKQLNKSIQGKTSPDVQVVSLTY